MRGKARFSKMSASVSRITPAYAGKRLTLHKIWQTVRDHPRLCGEKTTLRTVVQCDAGITPAYAGKSFKGECSGSDKRDHPRLCGEKISNLL